MRNNNSSLWNNKEVKRNISHLKTLRKDLGLTKKDLFRKTGIHDASITRYEKGECLPTPKQYNNLARVFGWKKVPVPAQAPPLIRPKKRLQPEQPSDFTGFIIGHVYTIKPKTHNKDAADKDFDKIWAVEFQFRYNGKQGIHHCFTEIHGGWNRTYADYQLIGKKIKEVTR